MDLQIPNKIYFKIGEVAQFMGVEPYVLRYWETEFPEIAPVQSKSKQRLYKREDVEKIAQIRDLLHKQGFTIKGARQKLVELKSPKSNKVPINQRALDASSQANQKLVSTVKQVVREMEDVVRGR